MQEKADEQKNAEVAAQEEEAQAGKRIAEEQMGAGEERLRGRRIDRGHLWMTDALEGLAIFVAQCGEPFQVVGIVETPRAALIPGSPDADRFLDAAFEQEESRRFVAVGVHAMGKGLSVPEVAVVVVLVDGDAGKHQEAEEHGESENEAKGAATERCARGPRPFHLSAGGAAAPRQG